MSEVVDLLSRVPHWLLRPLPANAVVDAALHADIDKHAVRLPQTLDVLTKLLDSRQPYADYDAAANRASAHVWLAFDRIFSEVEARSQLIRFARDHMTEGARGRLLRRLLRDASPRIRRAARRVLQQRTIREVALPATPDGDWDSSGWLRGVEPNRLFRQRASRAQQEKQGLPVLENVGQLRELLGISSRQQLGFFLLASDDDGGPYTRFTIPKRHGELRMICAPQPQLRRVQRRILSQILGKVIAHPAAHGFVPGRSTVSNAAPHQQAEIIVKFDLADFFPTIHYYRVMGLFASFGYAVDDGRFSSEDASRRVAATLARLCTYTAKSGWHGNGLLPQGAPTSPAISNLVCRMLDARLGGLAARVGAVYTRYADDLTFSFRATNVDLGRFRWWVDQICHQEGFQVNQAKFRAIRRSQRQSVTGIVVNEALRVPRRERRKFRALLHNCRQQGLAAHAQNHQGLASYLQGFASYIHMVHPEEGAKLLAEVKTLLEGQ